jgi:threonine dehydrogenase-like Zn-dependent dehydrogenase
MLAAVIKQPRTTVLVQAAVPRPGPGQVRVRIEGCGLCGSSLPVWEGREWFKYPLAPGEPGHEGWGAIDALGAGVESFETGDRVALISHNALAQYDIAPAAAVVKLPRWLGNAPFPGEPLACAMNIFARSDIVAGQTVAVVGIGFLGAQLCRLAISAGARVIAISRRPFSLTLARQTGATAVRMDAELGQAIHEVMEATDGKGCERVIEAAGVQSTLDLASELVCERGRLIIAGYHQDGPRYVNMQQWNWRGIDVINAHERDVKTYAQGIREALDAVANGVLDPLPLYTHTFALNQVDLAFEQMRLRPEGFVKALILT